MRVLMMIFDFNPDTRPDGMQPNFSSILSRHPWMAVIALLLGSFIAMPGVTVAAEMQVCDVATLNSAIANAGAGDRIVMCNKTWNNVDIAFDANGTDAAPVMLAAQTPGSVILAGSSRLHLGGGYVVADGLVFKGTYSGTKSAIEFRSKSVCTHCRLTNTSVINYNPTDNATYTVWVNLYGKYNRVDHCYFSGKTNSGQVVQVKRSNQADHHRIDHNYFGDRPVVAAGNFGEMVKIGGEAGTHDSISDTTVEDNFFYKADGEGEIISVKSSSNIIRHNTFDSSQGQVSLRQGNNNLVDGNFFFGRGIDRSGGVSMSGKGHIITNNYISNINPAERPGAAGIAIKNGNDDNYMSVKDVTVTFNTIVDSGYSFVLGRGNYPIAPENISIANNIVYSTNAPLIRMEHALINSNWTENTFYGTTLGITKPTGITMADPKLVLGADGVYRAVGATVLTPIGRCDVGPSTYDPTGTRVCTSTTGLSPPEAPEFL